jgi:hypothetical protein
VCALCMRLEGERASRCSHARVPTGFSLDSHPTFHREAPPAGGGWGKRGRGQGSSVCVAGNIGSNHGALTGACGMRHAAPGPVWPRVRWRLFAGVLVPVF